jgi:hypothetical protein
LIASVLPFNFRDNDDNKIVLYCLGVFMNKSSNQGKNVSISLHPHQVENLKDVEPGMTVVCDKGLLWLTESNNLQDYALKAGHSVVIRKKGKVLIEAVDEANLHIIYPN